MSHRIKILFRHRSMELGGVEKVLLNLLNHLDKDKFQVSLLLNLYQGELRNQIPEEIHFSYLVKGKEDFSKNPILYNIQMICRRIQLLFFDFFPSFVYKYKTQNNFDIEISTTYSLYSYVLKSPLKRSKKVGWFHTDVSYDTNKKQVLKRIHLMQQFDWMIFVSNQSRNVIKKLHNVEFPKSSVIYNSIPIDEIIKKSNEFKIKYDITPSFISVGRLHSRKGYSLLLNIHKKLISEGYHHSIVVIGNGSEKENLKNQIKELQVEKTFLLYGPKTNPFPYIKAADYFILPSKSESYPLVIGEAMILGKPIISTNVGGIPEMIDDGKDGILVNYNEDEIYHAMKQFLTEPKLIASLNSNMINSYKKFDKEKIYKEIENLFIQLHTS